MLEKFKSHIVQQHLAHCCMMLSTFEQVVPCPSGSMFRALITPSSAQSEKRLQRTLPKSATKSISSPAALVNSALGSDNMRILSVACN